MPESYIPMATFLGTLAVVVVGFLYNNSRMNDFRDFFTALLKAEAARNDANVRRMEEMLLGKFAELDSRLSRIENHLHLG